MSTFVTGGGTLQSTTLPNALFEAARLLDYAETTRNASQPTLAPKQNISTTVDFATKSIAIAATIPATFAPNASGQVVVIASDYLGAPWSSFAPGTNGTLKSANAVAAFVEVAQILSNGEKVVTPIEDQPNNVQVTIDAETATITVSANLPVEIGATEAGVVTLYAVDYL